MLAGVAVRSSATMRDVRDPAAERIMLPLLRQRWESVAFVHWRYEPRDVQKVLPPYLRVEEIDSSAWVGLVMFVARATRSALPRPRLADFPESNLRTYVTSPGGHRAIWFFSLEVANRAVVLAARSTLGVPYRWASMSVCSGPDTTTYVSRRREDRPVGHRIVVQAGEAIPSDAVSERDRLLTARFRAVPPRGGRILDVPVSHAPWPLQHAEVRSCEQDLTECAGLPATEGAAQALWSPGVDAAIGLPRFSRLVGRSTAP